MSNKQHDKDHLTLVDGIQKEPIDYTPEQSRPPLRPNPWVGSVKFDVKSATLVTKDTAERVVQALHDTGIRAMAYFERTVLQIMFEVSADKQESAETMDTSLQLIQTTEPSGVITYAAIEYCDPRSITITRTALGEVAVRFTPTVVPDQE